MFKLFAAQTVDGILSNITRQVQALSDLYDRKKRDENESLNLVEIHKQAALASRGEAERAIRIHAKLNELIS